MKINFSQKMLFLFSSLAVLIITAGCAASPAISPSPTSTSTPTGQQPIIVVSVTGPLPPINPGGPNVEITLKNVSTNPVASLTAALELTRAFTFNFDVSQAKPLLPENTVSAELTLIGGGFSDNISYTLQINGTFQNGDSFAYSEPVQIAGPAPTASPGASAQNSATVTSGNGLSLTLSLNSATYTAGDQISIGIDEKNTLTSENNIPAANQWPVKGLNLGPCGTLNYPFGIIILQGNYDGQSIVSVAPLQLYDPTAVYHCPFILASITSYNFQASSDTASIFSGDNSTPLTLQMTTGITASGVWTGSPKATFSNFAPGVYTVVGGDEWGTQVIGHFTVQSNNTSAG